MSFDKLFKLVDDKTQSFIQNLSSGYIEVPYIMSETLKILEDDSVFCNIVSDSNKKSLCIMLDQYFSDCWSMYIDDMKLDKLLKYGKIEIYKIDAANGLRYATTNEVAQGVKGLIGEYIYPAGEDIYKKLCLLEWSFNGISYYFRQAGYKLNYDSNGKVTNTFYEMIQMCARDLKDTFEWLSDKNEVTKSINRIKKLQKSKGYKYSSYEKDEIIEDISIKQLITNIYKVFPRNSDNANYRKALALSIKMYKNKQELSPLEISSLREIYEEYALDRGKNNQPATVNEDLKKKCALLLSERTSGKINHNHFAYTIIDTLKRNNYTKCSPKQYSIIEEALKLVGRDLSTEEDNRTEIISDSEIDLSLASLSNAIGDGLFEDGDD